MEADGLRDRMRSLERHEAEQRAATQGTAAVEIGRAQEENRRLELELEQEREAAQVLLGQLAALKAEMSEHRDAKQRAEEHALEHEEQRGAAEEQRDIAEKRARARAREITALRVDSQAGRHVQPLSRLSLCGAHS